MNRLPSSWHAPLTAPRPDSYGDAVLNATEAIIAAVHARDPHALQAAVDRVLAARQPAGEDPVTWLVAALAVQVDPSVPLEQRAAWVGGAA